MQQPNDWFTFLPQLVFSVVLYYHFTRSSAEDIESVLNGRQLWYKGEMPFADKMLLVTEEADNMLVKDAKMYEFLDQHPRLAVCHDPEKKDGRSGPFASST